jgi:dihydroneopterin aldolase
MAPPKAQPLIEISLRRMQFYAFVGILPHERDAAQPIEVDLTVWVSPAAGVVDYVKLYQAAARVFAAGSIDFMEQVAERIIDGSFAISERVRSVRVAVRKPHVQLGGLLDCAEIVVSRGADDVDEDETPPRDA